MITWVDCRCSTKSQDEGGFPPQIPFTVMFTCLNRALALKNRQDDVLLRTKNTTYDSRRHSSECRDFVNPIDTAKRLSSSFHHRLACKSMKSAVFFFFLPSLSSFGFGEGNAPVGKLCWPTLRKPKFLSSYSQSFNPRSLLRGLAKKKKDKSYIACFGHF